MADQKTCVTGPCGPVKPADCAGPFQLSISPDSCVIDQIVNESLLIAGADLYIYQLLGLSQHGKLTDLTGRGVPLASSSQPSYDALNAYDLKCGEWRSIERGSTVTQSAFLGYDFGEIKLDNGRLQYSVETYVLRLKDC